MLPVGKFTILNRFLEIFASIYGSFSLKIEENFLLSKLVSDYFKKVPTATKINIESALQTKNAFPDILRFFFKKAYFT